MPVSNSNLHLRRLKDVLSEKGISQRDLAERSGVSPTTINKVYHGTSTHSRTAQKIAHALGVSLAHLIGTDKAVSPVPSSRDLRVVAGQKDTLLYPEDQLITVIEARLNRQQRDIESIREMLKVVADSMEEIATRPVANPKRTTIVSEYE